MNRCGLLLSYILIPVRSDNATQTIILSRCVILPLKRAEVGEVVCTTFRNRSDVINFPSVIAYSVSIIVPANPCITLVFTPFSRINTNNHSCFLPYSKFRFVTKCHVYKNCIVKHLHPERPSNSLEQDINCENTVCHPTT